MLRTTPSNTRPWPPPSARLSLSTALAALCLAATQPVAAADNKAYPGSMCGPFSGAPDIEADGGNAAVINTSNSFDRTVTCPVVRDNTTNANGTGTVWVYVYRDPAAANSLTCTFYSTRASDGVTLFSPSALTNAAGFARLNITVPNSVAGGPYNLVCSLPPQSKIFAYLVPEY
jgi:hypothetical protein